MHLKLNSFCTFLIISLITTTAFTSCDSGYADHVGSYENAKMTLEQRESMDPTSFLASEGSYRSNLIGEWVVEGRVTSTAAIAKYKDVVLTINYYSKTNTLLGSEEHTLYEFISPGNVLDYKIKSFGYLGTHSIGAEVTGAETVY